MRNANFGMRNGSWGTGYRIGGTMFGETMWRRTIPPQVAGLLAQHRGGVQNGKRTAPRTTANGDHCALFTSLMCARKRKTARAPHTAFARL